MSKLTMEFARRDDCLDKIVPSDLRQLIGERDEAVALIRDMYDSGERCWFYSDRIDALLRRVGGEK